MTADRMWLELLAQCGVRIFVKYFVTEIFVSKLVGYVREKM